jgi:hypothetical protein
MGLIVVKEVEVAISLMGVRVLGCALVACLLGAPVLVAGCATSRTRVVIVETDNIERKDSWRLPPILLAKPERAARRIATLLAYQDAALREEELWHAIQVAAAEQGAQAVVVTRRRLSPCVRPSAGDFVQLGSYASGATRGEQTLECAQVRADLLIFEGRIDCSEEQICRDHIDDASNVSGRFALPLVRTATGA